MFALKERPEDHPPQAPGSVIALQTRQTDRYRRHKRWYVPIRVKFALAIGFSTLWMVLSIVLARPWAEALAEHITAPVAWIIIAGVALIATLSGFWLVAAGMMAGMTAVIGRLGGNIIDIHHNRLALDVPVKGAEYDIQVETRDDDHADQIGQALEKKGYVLKLP